MIQGANILLRSWQADDAPWYVNARDDEIFHWTTEKRSLTVAETVAAIAQVNASEHIFAFAVIARDTGAPAGNLALVLDTVQPDRGEIMYWLAPEARGRGLAVSAIDLLCCWAFKMLSLAQITLQTDIANERSQRAARRAGFDRCDSPLNSEAQPSKIWFCRARAARSS